MKATILYRAASVLFLLFAFGHTAGFLGFKPETPQGMAVMTAMNSVSFPFEGNSRTYGDFYLGFGLDFTVYLLFSAFLAWYLGRLAAAQPRLTVPIAWALAAVQVLSLVLSIKFFFIVPAVFSALAALSLAFAAVQANRA